MGVRQWIVIAGCAACQAPVEIPSLADTGVADACVAAPSEVLAGPFTDVVTHLVAQGDQVVWVQRRGAGHPTVMHAVFDDGSDPVQVRRSLDGHDIVSVAFAGDRLVFLETESTGGPSALYVTEIGGTASRVAVRTWTGAERLVGATATHAFVLYEGNDEVVVDRIELATGTPNRVGVVAGMSDAHHLVLDGDDLYFRASAAGNTKEPQLFRLSTQAVNRNAQPVGTIGHDRGCGWPAGGLAVTPSALVCGLGPLYAYPRASGMGPVEIAAPDPASDHVIFGASGETVFTIGTSDSTVDVPVLAVDSDGSDPQALACDARKVLPQMIEAAYPDLSTPQAVVTDHAVVWLDESRGRLAGVETITLRRAAR